MSTSAATRPTLTSFTLGPFATNCYVLIPSGQSGRGAACWIIDASFEPEEMLKFIVDNDLQPQAVILTHAHVDHIAGIGEVRRVFPRVPIWMHAAEASWLGDPLLNLSALSGLSVTAPGPDRLLSDGEVLNLGGDAWQVVHTPGHSPGGIALVCGKAGLAIVGDALFAGSIGRTDFPGSDHDLLARSIRERLYSLPDGVTIFPGHGPTSTIGREKRSNPFVRG